MSYYAKDELLKMAVDLATAVFSGSGDVIVPSGKSEEVATFIQVVYDKLVEIDESIKD